MFTDWVKTLSDEARKIPCNNVALFITQNVGSQLKMPTLVRSIALLAGLPLLISPYQVESLYL